MQAFDCPNSPQLEWNQIGVKTNRVRLYRTHGITRDPAKMRGASEGPRYCQQLDLGLNYRTTDLQAALGTSQIRRLEEFIRRRTELANRHDTLLSELPVIPAPRCPRKRSAWHRYVIQLFPEHETRRLNVIEVMRSAGIGVNAHYMPVHLQPYYRNLGCCEGDFLNAERYLSRAVTLPLYPGLRDLDQERVVASLSGCILATGVPPFGT